MAKRVKAAGMGFLLDFHYSDNWADPGKQVKPAAWQGLAFDALTTAVHDYTKDAISQLVAAGARPDLVQIGNEITPGMLLPDGAIGNWKQLGALLKAGIAGVKEVAPSTKIMLHIDRGGDNMASRYWFDNAIAQGVAFDVGGESCYPEFQGMPAVWKTNLTDLVARYPKLSFAIAEYSKNKQEANDIVFGLSANKGFGTFIWEPTKYSEAIFDAQGNTLPLITTYDQIAKSAAR
jgi:arabinogalactan endo-1,4-beta-galactosidase